MKRAGWTRISATKRKTDAHWIHKASGFQILHCGHPTANWPYYAIDPADPGRTTVTHNGLGFRTLKDAFDQIDGVIAGTMVATNDNCGPTTRRVIEA